MGVQKIARERAGRSAVQFIARHGMANARQMYPDLMRPAGADPHFQVAEAVKRSSTLYIGNGRPAGG